MEEDGDVRRCRGRVRMDGPRSSASPDAYEQILCHSPARLRYTDGRALTFILSRHFIHAQCLPISYRAVLLRPRALSCLSLRI